jgi:hypothetical protein
MPDARQHCAPGVSRFGQGTVFAAGEGDAAARGRKLSNVMTWALDLSARPWAGSPTKTSRLPSGCSSGVLTHVETTFSALLIASAIHSDESPLAHNRIFRPASTPA